MNDGELAQRVSKLETADALSVQSRRNLHEQYEALSAKLDLVLLKMDSRSEDCGVHRTATALQTARVSAIDKELDLLADDVKWALRLAIVSLGSVCGTLAFYLLTKG